THASCLEPKTQFSLSGQRIAVHLDFSQKENFGGSKFPVVLHKELLKHPIREAAPGIDRIQSYLFLIQEMDSIASMPLVARARNPFPVAQQSGSHHWINLPVRPPSAGPLFYRTAFITCTTPGLKA